MNRLFSAKPLLAAAVALGALGAASTAQARTDVAFSIGFVAPAYVEPAPVYAAPTYVQPQAVYVPQVTYYGDYGRYDNWERRREWREHEWRERHHRRDVYRAGWDRDHDGVPNRYDRFPLNPYRR